MKSIKNFIKSLLSGKDEISSNRTIGILAFFVFIGVIGFGLYSSRVDVQKFDIALSYILYLIIAMFFLKSGEKITDIITSISQKKSKNPSDSE